MEPHNLISKQTVREEGVNLPAVYAKGLTLQIPLLHSARVRIGKRPRKPKLSAPQPRQRRGWACIKESKADPLVILTLFSQDLWNLTGRRQC